MERNFLAASAAAFLALGTSMASADELLDRAKKVFKPVPDSVPTLKDNTVTPEKVELGRMLFFEPRLSKSGVISCNTCHNLGTGGADNVPTSVGHGWQRGPRNSPTVFNAVFHIAQFWDGRAKDLKAQAKGPVQAAVEMSNTPARVEKTLKSIPRYVQLFGKAFPKAKEQVTFDHMAMAIEAFEATLTTPNAPFDRWLKGEKSALNDQQRNGLRLFMDKGCVACHSGVNLGGNGYYRFGAVTSPGAKLRPVKDMGRFKITHVSSDKYVFRTPTLRNVALTAPYFHSGQVWSLREAVEVMAKSQLGKTLKDNELDDITAFLHTLTGEQPKVVYPKLPASTPSTPRPTY
jgi:cytochrome c peroxidase